MKLIVRSVLMTLLFLPVSALAQNVYDFPLEGSQEVPPVASAASGTCTASIDALETTFSLNCTHDVTDLVGAHIHNAAAGVNGPIVFFLDTDTTFSATVTEATLTAQNDSAMPVAGITFEAFLQALHSGALYVNVHSPANPSGEIRGQIPAPPTKLYFAQFGNGSAAVPAGSAGPFLRSDIVLLNSATTGEPVTGTVTLYNADGSPLPVEDAFGDAVPAGIRPTAHGFDFELPPLGDMTFSTPGTGDLVQGSAVVTSSAPVAGVVRFEISGIGIAGVGASEVTDRAIAPARRSGLLTTGLAIRNAEDRAINVTLSLRENGVEVADGNVEMMLEPNARVSRFIEDYFPDAETDGFVGTVIITADGGFAAIALEFDAFAPIFTTLPVTPLFTPSTEPEDEGM